MFIDDFVPIQRSLLVANAWLLSHGAELAHEAATVAAPPSAITLGVPRTRLDTLVIPLAWSTTAPAAFRHLEGDLVTAGLGPDRTHLRLSASCELAVEPPGRRAQEAAALRAAEQHVRSFLAHLAGALEVRSAD